MGGSSCFVKGSFSAATAGKTLERISKETVERELRILMGASLFSSNSAPEDRWFCTLS
jgi:hypothetical protein